MIEGYNATSVNTDVMQEKDYRDFYGNPVHNSFQEIIDDLERRKNNIANGGINSIPIPFVRFRKEFPGIEQEQYLIFTANTKIGKTQIASFLTIYSVLDFAFENPDKCSVDVLYFNLEESVARVKHRYISYLLNKFDGYRISPRDLRSTDSDYPLPDEALELIKSPKYTERLAFFDEVVHFNNTDTNPTGILRVCEEFAKSIGEYKTRTVKSRGDANREVEEFVSYKQYDKNHYTIVFVDHARLIDAERGYTQKQTIDKFSEYAIKYLRDRYRQTVVLIQQQMSDIEGLEAIKQKRMTPSKSGLGDTKYTAHDCNYLFGLFDPSVFGLPAWLGYTIQDASGKGLLNYSRFFMLLSGRDGEAGGVCPLFFDGATCTFEELPRPDDKNIEVFYEKAKKYKGWQRKKANQNLFNFLIFFKKLKTFLI